MNYMEDLKKKIDEDILDEILQIVELFSWADKYFDGKKELTKLEMYILYESDMLIFANCYLEKRIVNKLNVLTRLAPEDVVVEIK